MAGWERVWTDEQKEAVATAYEDRGIRPYSHLAAVCAAGELEHDGKRLDSFAMPAATIRTEVRQLRLRRVGLISSELAQMPPEDAIEALRRRLVNASDAMLRVEERKGAKADPARIREIAKCVREAAAIPGPRDRRPVKPGQRDPETGLHNGDRTHAGLAHEILKSHRAGQPAPSTYRTGAHTDSTGDAQRAASEGTSEGTEQDTTGPLPGSHAFEHVAQVEQQSA